MDRAHLISSKRQRLVAGRDYPPGYYEDPNYSFGPSNHSPSCRFGRVEGHTQHPTIGPPRRFENGMRGPWGDGRAGDLIGHGAHVNNPSVGVCSPRWRQLRRQWIQRDLQWDDVKSALESGKLRAPPGSRAHKYCSAVWNDLIALRNEMSAIERSMAPGPSHDGREEPHVPRPGSRRPSEIGGTNQSRGYGRARDSGRGQLAGQGRDFGRGSDFNHGSNLGRGSDSGRGRGYGRSPGSGWPQM